MEKIMVDKDNYDFYKYVYFGSFKSEFEAAIKRAYLDMNRTIRYKNIHDQERLNLRMRIEECLRTEIISLRSRNSITQEEFDEWHYDTAKQIRKIYRDAGIDFTYGQCQKWINMTIKYLYILDAISEDEFFQFYHIPLDNYVFDIAQDALGIKRPKKPWSRWDNYFDEYLAYQKEIRKCLKGITPLRWEFRFWLKEAKQK